MRADADGGGADLARLESPLNGFSPVPSGASIHSYYLGHGAYVFRDGPYALRIGSYAFRDDSYDVGVASHSVGMTRKSV